MLLCPPATLLSVLDDSMQQESCSQQIPLHVQTHHSPDHLVVAPRAPRVPGPCTCLSSFLAPCPLTGPDPANTPAFS